MKTYITLLIFIIPYFGLYSQTVQGTIAKTGSNTVTIYGNPSSTLTDVEFDNVYLCISIPDLGVNNPTATITNNLLPSLVWLTAGSNPDIIGSRAYYTFTGFNDNNSLITWANNFDNPIIEITFSNGIGSEIVQLNNIPGGGPSNASYWYVQIVGTGDITNYAEMFYGAGAVNNDQVSPSYVPTAEAVVLPIELTSFTARIYKKTAVLLDWRTASEANNLGFDVQRSNDGKYWEMLHFEKGNGITAEAQDYSFLDEKPLPGVNYYRLRQMDFDGSEQFSRTLSVDVERLNGSFSLYTNPASGTLMLALSSDYIGDATLILYDHLGRPVKTQSLFIEGSSFPIELEISDLPTGMFLAEVIAGQVEAVAGGEINTQLQQLKPSFNHLLETLIYLLPNCFQFNFKNHIMKNIYILSFLPFILLVSGMLHGQEVGIGTVAPDSSSALDISSTDKGFLMPRMSSAQRDSIILPATGLMIYNLTTDDSQLNTSTPLIPNWIGIKGGLDSTAVDTIITSVTATGDINTTSIIDTLIPGMSLSPPAGTYLIFFNGQYGLTASEPVSTEQGVIDLAAAYDANGHHCNQYYSWCYFWEW